MILSFTSAGIAFEVLFTHLHYDGQQLVHAPVLAHGKERLGKEAVHFLISIAKYHVVVGKSPSMNNSSCKSPNSRIKNQPSSFAFMLLSFTNGSDQKRES